MADLRDLDVRRAAMARTRALSRAYDDIVPVAALREGFSHAGRRWSYGSFYSGIFRPAGFVGPAALSVVTTPPKVGRDAPLRGRRRLHQHRFRAVVRIAHNAMREGATSGVVNIAGRLLREIDGPMLSSGLQAFHGEAIELPRRRVQHPDPDRLELRYEQFKAAG
jgi:hypothetical protein